MAEELFLSPNSQYFKSTDSTPVLILRNRSKVMGDYDSSAHFDEVQVDETLVTSGPKTGDIVFDEFDVSSLPFEKEEWSVIIIGSSMVGMMTGLLLGYHG